MNGVSLLKLLLIAELLAVMVIGFASLKKTMHRNAGEVRQFQAEWVRDENAATNQKDGSEAILTGVSGSSAGRIPEDGTPVTGSETYIPVIPADLLGKDYDSETVTGASYTASYTEEVMDRLSVMSTEEKIDALIVNSKHGTSMDNPAFLEVRYTGETDPDSVISSINDGDTCLYYTDDPEELKKALLEAVSTGDILTEALDKAVGAAISIYNEADYGFGTDGSEISEISGNSKSAGDSTEGAAAGNANSAAEVSTTSTEEASDVSKEGSKISYSNEVGNKSSTGSKKTTKSTASSKRNADEAAAQAALQQQLAEQIQKALLEQAAAAASASGSAQEGNSQ